MASHPFTCPAIRRIWGSPDALLLFFAGAAGEFAAIKAVDWLFFTHALPAAPIDRFFETVRFAQHVFFGTPAQAAATIATINRIHREVEAARGRPIPEWAYRDVLFLLLDYGERAHAIIYGPMSAGERQAHFEAILALGHAMQIRELPATYTEYQAERHQHLLDDYASGPLTERLFGSYRAGIGAWRFWLLRRIQAGLLPSELRSVLGLRPSPLVNVALRCCRYLPGGGNKLRWLHGLLLPRGMVRHLRRLGRGADERPHGSRSRVMDRVRPNRFQPTRWIGAILQPGIGKGGFSIRRRGSSGRLNGKSADFTTIERSGYG